jgi:hypothetical protein
MMQNLQTVVVEAKNNSIKYKNILTEEIFLNFCQDNYFNSECSGKNEFMDDLKRIKYVKRLIQKIHKNKTIKSIRERLIINHIIILKNVFGEDICARILFFKLEPRLHSYLKSFLVYLEFNLKNFPEADYKKINTDPRVDRKLKSSIV